jgi:hypothetical protein
MIKIDGNKKRERFLFVNLNMKINGYMVTSNKQSPIITDTVKPTHAVTSIKQSPTARTARFSKKSPWSVFFRGEMSVICHKITVKCR